MAYESLLVYRIVQGDTVPLHNGNFRVEEAGSVLILEANNFEDDIIGDLTHTGGTDVTDQVVVSSNVTGINAGDFFDSRYKYNINGTGDPNAQIYFITTNSQLNYGELIFSNVPLTPGALYSFGAFDTDGFAVYDDLVPCFTNGTMISTPDGDVPIETLASGDLIQTMDDGAQPLRWIGQKKLSRDHLKEHPSLWPIRIKAGALGTNVPASDLVVSRQHRILVRSKIATRMFGTEEVLLPANKLTQLDGIDEILPEDGVTYFHLLLDRHQIVFADGAWSESLFTGQQAMKALSPEAREEILALFPDIQKTAILARPEPIKGSKMKQLVARHAKNEKPVQHLTEAA